MQVTHSQDIDCAMVKLCGICGECKAALKRPKTGEQVPRPSVDHLHMYDAWSVLY